ncbi:MAG: hypothetical protein KY391_00790 [Actinobacteria bacterium]|nr:hypothetical protein [Actinomycetota bacterium]
MALVTVLFVGAVMTVTVSAAAFIAVQEFRAANRDRGATTALALSEAGIDRTMQWIRSNKTTWRYIVLSGCDAVGTVEGVSYSPITLNGQIGTGTYSTTIRRADGCQPLPVEIPSPTEVQQLILTSVGCTNNTVGQPCPTGSAKRLVEQAVAVRARPLPVGMSGNRVDARGNPTFQDMVVFARGIVNTRAQITMRGIDPYWEKSDFYPCVGAQNAPLCFPGDSDSTGDMPASIHSTDRIFLSPNGRDEHPPHPNCTSAQYTWDGSATGADFAEQGLPPAPPCPAYPNSPPTSLFTDADADRLARDPRLTEEDHLFFKQIAQQAGLYCDDYRPSAPNACTKAGITPFNVMGEINNNEVAGLGNYFVVYIEFPDGTDPQANMLNWNVTTPAPSNTCNTTAATNMSVLVIVRNGGFEPSQDFLGAVFAEDGRFEIGGGRRVEGTVAAQFIRTRGQPTVCNSPRWVESMPGVFLQVTPLQWSEVDR